MQPIFEQFHSFQWEQNRHRIVNADAWCKRAFNIRTSRSVYTNVLDLLWPDSIYRPIAVDVDGFSNQSVCVGHSLFVTFCIFAISFTINVVRRVSQFPKLSKFLRTFRGYGNIKRFPHYKLCFGRSKLEEPSVKPCQSVKRCDPKLRLSYPRADVLLVGVAGDSLLETLHGPFFSQGDVVVPPPEVYEQLLF